VAYAAELCTAPVQPATDSQLDFLSDLNKKRARDGQVRANRIEASAWIEFYLRKRHREALKKLRPEAGDIVQLEDSGGIRHEEVVSIGIDGRIYFRGGHGASAWPDRVTLLSRRTDNSKRARVLKKAALNDASARLNVRHWSLAKQAELRRFEVTAPLTQGDIDQLRNVIDRAQDEKSIQKLLEERPQILAALVGRKPSYVVPRPQMAGIGGARVPDFLIADVDSSGINWVLIELETPRSGVTLKNDNILEEHARKGVSQVEEWREWIQNNLYQARLSHKDGGLGLVDIRPQSKGLVLVGRRALLADNAREVRFAYAEKQRIEVHTYDYLLATLEGAMSFSGPSGLNPYLIQPWRDGDGEQPSTNSEEWLGT